MQERRFDITRIDPNFKSADAVFEGMTSYNVCEPPFEIKGVYFDGEGFTRMPRDIAKRVNESVAALCSNTSGGRIRFRTDSQRITLTAIVPSVCDFSHMPRTGSCRFDLYVDGEYLGFFGCKYLPREDGSGLLEGSATSIDLPSGQMHEILIHFPLYNDVNAVYLSLENGSRVEAPTPEHYERPVVFYGSSITQGGCASHAGNAYVNILGRRLHTHFLNLGFSAGCHAEPVMMDYLSSLDMSIFVYDYDHNAPNCAFLARTHEAGYQRFRASNPNVPILMISSADIKGERAERCAVIRTTYENAVRAGDKNVYFIDGDEIYAPVGSEYCTVDRCHPNDLGFWCMANRIEKTLREILEKGD